MTERESEKYKRREKEGEEARSQRERDKIHRARPNKGDLVFSLT